MAFCARCGATAQPGTRFCTGCGAALDAPSAAQAPPVVYGAPAAGAAPYAAPAPTPRGPVGERQEPWLVLLLVFVTFGIYQYLYYWRIARETDAHAGRGDHAGSPARFGAILGIIASVGMAFSMIMFTAAFFSTFADAAMTETEPSEAAIMGVFGTWWVAMMAFAALGFVGKILMYVGAWRSWSFIRDDERHRGVGDQLSPGTMLAFSIVPYLNLVTLWIALYVTQDHLNRVWDAAARPPQASPQVSGAAPPPPPPASPPPAP